MFWRENRCTELKTFSSQEATILLVSTKNRDLWPNQFVEHAQSTRSIFSANQICQILGADQKDRGLWERE